jgi:DNA-directed RNA polymerase specialized sigma24 family protein
MTTPRTIEVTASHEGKWWEISFQDDDLDTVTSTRNINDVEAMAIDAAALWLDVDPATITVNVTYALPEAYRSNWETAQAKAAAAREAEAEAAQLRRTVIANLRADGYTLAEAGKLLGLSKGRVHQLAAVATDNA